MTLLRLVISRVDHEHHGRLFAGRICPRLERRVSALCRVWSFDCLQAMLFGIVFLAFLPFQFVLAIAPALLPTTFTFRSYITTRIGGYTGDCLGALQQIAEVEFYLGYVLFQDLRI